jgi:hypothetical protein
MTSSFFYITIWELTSTVTGCSPFFSHRDTLASLTFFDENYDRNVDIYIYAKPFLCVVCFRFVIPKQLPNEEVSKR